MVELENHCPRPLDQNDQGGIDWRQAPGGFAERKMKYPTSIFNNDKS